VAVQYGDKDSLQGALAKPLTVQYGNSPVAGTAISRSVSVQRGSSSTQSAAITPPIAVQYGNEAGQGTFYGAAVSATTGPYINAISPNSVSRGATVTVTFSGVNLSGATNLRFINSSGTLDTTSIVATNLSVSADGTTLTATLAVSSGAAPGSRVVVVTTPNGDSMFVNVGTNVIQIVSP
jgi:hypothetical protein